MRLTARWIIPVDQPPLEWGVIDIDGDRIRSIAPAATSAADNAEPALNLGECAILPGLVNAHTHLEFSSLACPIEAADSFADWIARVVDHRRSAPHQDDAIANGLGESQAAGVTTLGEIATSDEWRTLPAAQGAGVVFREIIALAPDRWQQALDVARTHLSAKTANGWIHGLSPHAPYSVHPALYQQLIDLAIEAGAPVAVHLAETQEELELLEHGRGPLVEQLKKFGAWQEGLIPRGSRPVDYLHPLAEVDRGLIVHGNYLADDEIEFISQHPNLSVVFCPRTHAAFGHSPHPWLKMMEAGVRVTLGTDSRASNPDLSLWNEVRYLAERFSDIDPALLIRMATLQGAQALGCESQVGSLTKGKLANLVVVRPRHSDRDESTAQSGAAESFALSAVEIAGVMRAGRWIRRAE